MKKVVALVGTILLLILTLGIVGCGGSKSGSTTGQSMTSPQNSGTSEGSSLTEILSKGKGTRSMSYDFVLTTPQITRTGKVWIDETHLKTDSTVEGKRIITYFDRTTNTATTYYPEQNQAVKLSAGADSNETPSPSDYAENLDSSKVKFIRTETYDGATCKVLEVIAPNNQGEKVMLWIREDLGLPVRVEVTVPSGEKTVIEYKNLQVGPIPPETFELPRGVKVTDLGQMMKRLPAKVPGQ